ncbi:hypothetical protein TNCV_1565371 [Trichonephila clavipes]|nr:hypothetical protein TNCV_1565371 [Trichonephila clavipes]
MLKSTYLTLAFRHDLLVDTPLRWMQGIYENSHSPTCDRFFAMLPVRGKKAVLEWCMKEGLIGSSYVCPKFGKSMELRERTGKKVNDRF